MNMGKKSKEDKKLLKQIRKMKKNDEITLHGYDIICVEEQVYLLIHYTGDMIEKCYDEIKDWCINGGELV